MKFSSTAVLFATLASQIYAHTTGPWEIRPYDSESLVLTLEAVEDLTFQAIDASMSQRWLILDNPNGPGSWVQNQETSRYINCNFADFLCQESIHPQVWEVNRFDEDGTISFVEPFSRRTIHRTHEGNRRLRLLPANGGYDDRYTLGQCKSSVWELVYGTIILTFIFKGDL
ncbi:hypothetical protein N7474_003969 [Penicillium riverlandense]|uniref:uncharacterized protein n=1 Tax=Penicillium riverlandense TaxID=1903569 RepID=UPI00254902C1|nr:uncharacterized protein N7474_003969 [Penicillium riverlandense]KAJ5818378.1 hypothetical protein N7474_003969 [Penicillium riverlandense]